MSRLSKLFDKLDTPDSEEDDMGDDKNDEKETKGDGGKK